FHDVERIDVIKMYRLFQPLMELPFEAPEPTRSVGMYVLERFQAQEIQPRIARAMERLEICHGLTEEQSERLVVEFDARSVGRNETIFSTSDDADEMLLILDGDVRIEVDGRPVGSVGPGECLGEVAFMSESPHSATAVAESELEVAVLKRSSLHGLVRSRPDIGTVVYRNLAMGLGAKLRRADGVC
ncbi:MAG: cyclic nucleotide-binding domain-containing protein, partial [Gemmatimonadetes bacterium]|nr:cyclic nucleotide-binding domain-containing protein [Gemmatimonadota bacterium]